MKCVLALIFWAEISEVSQPDPGAAIDWLENGLMETFAEQAASELCALEPFVFVEPLRAVVQPIVGGVFTTWEAQRRDERGLLAFGGRRARRPRSWEGTSR